MKFLYVNEGLSLVLVIENNFWILRSLQKFIWTVKVHYNIWDSSWRFLRSNSLEQLWFKLYKIIRIYKLTDFVRKIIKFTNVSCFRDFTGGTLGLAWVASASGASGGICETYKRYTENINGVHHTAKRSLNTGIITFVNYNSPVPPKGKELK